MENLKSNKIRKHDEHEFSTDELMEIFSRLPAKVVIKFSSLNKSIHTLLLEPLFVEKHLIRSPLVDEGFFMQQSSFHCQKKEVEFHVLPGVDRSKFGIRSDTLSLIAQKGRVVASTQGLLLLHNNFSRTNSNINNELFICNPATGSCVRIPAMPRLIGSRVRGPCSEGLIFECYPRNLDNNGYIVAIPLLFDEISQRKLIVYRNGKWEKDLCSPDEYKRRGQYDVQLCNPVCLFKGHTTGGLVIHYLVSSWEDETKKPCIVGYDLDMKKFTKEIDLPHGSWNWKVTNTCYADSNTKIFKCKRGGSGSETILLVKTCDFSVIDGSFMFTVWVMDDYELGSWRRILNKTILQMGLP